MTIAETATAPGKIAFEKQSRKQLAPWTDMRVIEPLPAHFADALMRADEKVPEGFESKIFVLGDIGFTIAYKVESYITSRVVIFSEQPEMTVHIDGTSAHVDVPIVDHLGVFFVECRPPGIALLDVSHDNSDQIYTIEMTYLSLDEQIAKEVRALKAKEAAKRTKAGK